MACGRCAQEKLEALPGWALRALMRQRGIYPDLKARMGDYIASLTPVLLRELDVKRVMGGLRCLFWLLCPAAACCCPSRRHVHLLLLSEGRGLIRPCCLACTRPRITRACTVTAMHKDTAGRAKHSLCCLLKTSVSNLAAVRHRAGVGAADVLNASCQQVLRAWAVPGCESSI